MSKLETDLPERITGEIDRLVEQGEFINREQAIEELLSMGVSAYSTDVTTDEEEDVTLFTQTVEEQQDPAMQDEGDEYTF
jgi:metal-responsive CopG/Arc/MetJ family transcriptional regulator